MGVASYRQDIYLRFLDATDTAPGAAIVGSPYETSCERDNQTRSRQLHDKRLDRAAYHLRLTDLQFSRCSADHHGMAFKDAINEEPR